MRKFPAIRYAICLYFSIGINTQKNNQDIMKKLLEEAKGQDATVFHLHIKGTINSPSIPLPFNSVVSVHRVVL